MEEKMKNTATKKELTPEAQAALKLLGAIAFCGNKTLLTPSTDGYVAKFLSHMQMTDEELMSEFPDEVIHEFRTMRGHPLKGLLIFGDDTVTVDFKDLPEDHMIPEVIEAQRRYLIHRIIKSCRAKFTSMDRAKKQ